MTPTGERRPSAILLVSCVDRPGLVAELAGFVFSNGGNILAADQHSEPDNGMFFLRLVWDTSGFALDRSATAAALGQLARRSGLTWSLRYSDERERVAVLVSRTPQCLYDLMLADQVDELGGTVTVVISNHDDLRPVAGHFGIPYHHVPSGGAMRDGAEQRMTELLAEHRVDLVVLARYMQVLSPAFVDRWLARMINIHHSFLPAFVGAQAYRQARDRGVKMIGATAHYVTNDLDQGPIVEQDVVRVSHRDTVDDLVRKGRELERTVLTRAVRYHLERRVLISGNRTVVFT